jgi:hypothetical protein
MAAIHMKKCILVFLVVAIASALYAEELIDFDYQNRIVYVSESAWFTFPVKEKISLLEKIKPTLPKVKRGDRLESVRWDVKGMYGNKLLAVINADGSIEIK